MNSYLKHVLLLFILAIVFYLVHNSVISQIGLSNLWSQSGYKLSNMYLLGLACSIVVTILIFITNKIMPKNLGIAFLVAISLKVLVFFIYIHKGLYKFDNKFLEYNFIIVFFLFLITDVFVAFKALNDDMGRV